MLAWQTRTLDRRGIWWGVLVAFWLLLANQSHVFRSFRAENLRWLIEKEKVWRICFAFLHEWLVLPGACLVNRRFLRFSTVVATQGSWAASKTQGHKGRLNVKMEAALLFFVLSMIRCAATTAENPKKRLGTSQLPSCEADLWRYFQMYDSLLEKLWGW